MAQEEIIMNKNELTDKALKFLKRHFNITEEPYYLDNDGDNMVCVIFPKAKNLESIGTMVKNIEGVNIAWEETENGVFLAAEILF